MKTEILIFASFSQVWINSSDIILLGLRDYQDTKADVILKYTPGEARNLKAYGELPDNGLLEYSKTLYISYNSSGEGSVLLDISIKSILNYHVGVL